MALFGSGTGNGRCPSGSSLPAESALNPKRTSESLLEAGVVAPCRHLKKQNLSNASANWGPKTEAFWQQLPAMTCLHGNLPFHNVFSQF